MTDQPTRSHPSGRGRTEIATKAVEHIATIAALEVDGVARTGNDLEKLVGRRLPKATATVAGSRTSLRVEVATTWPRSLPGTAAAVRARVTDRVHELTGMNIDRVDVEVVKVILEAAPRRSIA